MTGERPAGSRPPRPCSLTCSPQLPRAQRDSMRPVPSVISNRPLGMASDSSPSRLRAASPRPDARAASRSGSPASAVAPDATSCTCCRNSPRATCSPRSASNRMPCSTLEKISTVATTETASTGASAAAISAIEMRRRNPRRCMGTAAGNVQFELPRPSHSAGR